MTEVSTVGQADSAPAPAPDAPAPQPTEAPPAASTDDLGSKLTSAGYADNLDGALNHAAQYRSAQKAGAIDGYRQVQEQAERLGYDDVPSFLSAVAQVEAEQAADAPPATAPATDGPVTLDNIDEIVAQRVSEGLVTFQSDAEEKYAVSQQELAVQAARQAENTFYLDTLKEGKYEVPDKGDLPLSTLGASAMLQQCLRSQKIASVGEFATDTQKEAAIAAHPTQGQLDAAKAQFVNSLKDNDMKVVDNYAAGQDTIPTSVPGGPPSGAIEPLTPVNPLTMPADKREAFMTRVAAKLGMTLEEFNAGDGL